MSRLGYGDRASHRVAVERIRDETAILVVRSKEPECLDGRDLSLVELHAILRRPVDRLAVFASEVVI